MIRLATTIVIRRLLTQRSKMCALGCRTCSAAWVIRLTARCIAGTAACAGTGPGGVSAADAGVLGGGDASGAGIGGAVIALAIAQARDGAARIAATIRPLTGPGRVRAAVACAKACRCACITAVAGATALAVDHRRAGMGVTVRPPHTV